MSTDSPVATKPRRNRWIWVSAVLAVVAAGLLIWALTIQSDLDSTQQELAGVQEELDSTQQALDAARRMIYFRLAADADQFLTVAKFRGIRKLWARVEEACGLPPAPAFVAA